MLFFDQIHFLYYFSYKTSLLDEKFCVAKNSLVAYNSLIIKQKQ